MKLKWMIIITLIVLLAVFHTPIYTQLSELNTQLSESFSVEPDQNQYFVSDQGDIQLFFCPQEDCEGAFVNFLDSAQQSIHCALFEIDLPSVQQKLREKAQQIEVKIVTDDQYIDQFNEPWVKSDRSGLMHNKFCIIDGKEISTGSMNPTVNCAHKNNNHLLLIDSTVLARNYDDEFTEMWNGVFKKGDPVAIPKVLLGNISIQNCFCPEDHCADKVKEELKQAHQSINFMVFSFTHQGIADIILLKKMENVSIQGVMETTQISDYSVFKLLTYNGIDVLKDGNKKNLHHNITSSIDYCPRLGILHHKVFIIDNETVITGSYNPTQNGDTRNDENLLIIHSPEIAAQFLDEFNCIWARND